MLAVTLFIGIIDGFLVLVNKMLHFWMPMLILNLTSLFFNG